MEVLSYKSFNVRPVLVFSKESHMLQVSVTKILGDYSGNTKMPN